ncbi:hypothetical protein [Clostridium lacusfryxellense]|uniref:hypothetical protein n=1 Tax=Clostridium lacusfryxellense TaxID=205328 RepID=UPI001C0D3C0F|nr:hypothetical protein [Clostridium lacusfryxellense]MBU3114882.1 hypothetical protein [Clostridium lacusfryxellense]
MGKDKIYNGKLLAFIDILGFSNQVKISENDNDYAKSIKKVLSYFLALKKDNDNGALSLRDMGKEVTVFSDSIVISYPVTLQSVLFYMLIDIIHIQLDLLPEKILIRGGVAIGDVYHDGNMVFGPAMNEAYKLESECANYPRIILTEDTITNAIIYKSDNNTIEQELEYVMDLVRKDKDGFYYIDFLKQYCSASKYSFMKLHS